MSFALTSRAFQDPAQRRLFNRFHIFLFGEDTSEDDPVFLRLVSRIDGTISDKRLSSYISCLQLEPRGYVDMARHPRILHVVEHLFDGIDRFISLEKLGVVQMHISCTIADKLFAFMTSHPLSLDFMDCRYPGDEYIYPKGDIKLIELSLHHMRFAIPPTETFVARLLEPSRTNLKKLSYGTMASTSISSLPPLLPSLVSLTIGYQGSEADAFREFLLQSNGLEELRLRPDSMVFYLPPTALPVLRSLSASASWVTALVPGRPLTSVDISSGDDDYDLLDTVPQLKHSTRPVTDLNLWILTRKSSNMKYILSSIVQCVPHLQNLVIFFNKTVGTLRRCCHILY